MGAAWIQTRTQTDNPEGQETAWFRRPTVAVAAAAPAMGPTLIHLKEEPRYFIEIAEMRRSLDATNLGAADIEPAFALVQALHPSLTLDNWRSFAIPLVDQEPLAQSGLVGVRNEASYLCGLFVYRVESDLAHERAFIVDVIAALDVVGRQVCDSLDDGGRASDGPPVRLRDRSDPSKPQSNWIRALSKEERT